MNPHDRTFSFQDHDENFLTHSSQQRPVDISLNRHPPITSGSLQQLQQPQQPSYAIPPPRGYTYSPQPPLHHYLQQQSQPYSFPLPLPTSLDPYTQIPALDSRQNSHRLHDADVGRQGLKYSDSTRTASTTTPGIDNMAASAAGGGIAGIALGVASTNERESGVEALRSLDRLTDSNHGLPPEREYNALGSDTPYIPATPSGFRPPNRLDPYASPAPSATNPFDDENRQISATPSLGQLTPRPYQSRPGIPMHEYPSHDGSLGAASSYSDNPYKRVSTAWDPRIGEGDIDPNEIEDDGDDGMAHIPRRKSVPEPSPPGGVAIGAAAGGGILGALGGLVGKKNVVPEGGRDPSGQYGPVPRSGFDDAGVEKSDWLKRQTSGRSRLRWIVGIIIGILIIAGICGGAIGGIRAARSNGSDPAPQGKSAEDDSRDNGDLGKDSTAIQQLMNNADLHKVFPGVAYTPFNAQYPACLTNPPSQNNVTRDMAVLSQLTNTIRLYGTDCNQTQMVLHAIDRLALSDMKVWLGVWLERNTTTNKRQISDMYQILDEAGVEPFAGVVIGNEVLFAESLTEATLEQILTETKQNFTEQKIDLPVATSDLGDRWTPALVSAVDVVMSNIHPFFSGVEVEVASGWTWNFWQRKDVALTAGTTKKNIISEVGWPSQGGRSCGAVNCTDAITSSSVAGIDEMNRFMDDFVCPSLANGTDYFWYV